MRVPGPTRSSVLALPGFRWLFLSRLASVLAATMVPTALAFALLQSGGALTRQDAGGEGGAGTLGLLLAARGAAQVVFLLLGGVLADRWPRRALMVCAETAAGVAQLGVAAVFLTATGSGAGQVPASTVLVVLSVLGGAASALFVPAATGIVPTLVPAPRLQAANSLLRLSENVGAVLGAVAAGVITQAASAGWALAATGALYFVSALLLAGLQHAPAASSSGDQPVPAGAAVLWQDLRGGFREFASRRWVWVVVAQFSVLNACFGGLTRVLGPLVALRTYAGPTSWSWALSAETAGLLLGGLLALRVRPVRPLRLATGLTVAFVPPLLLLASGAPLGLLLAAMLLCGLATTVFEVLWATALQQHVPVHALSRVSSYDVLGSVALTPLVLAAAGPAADVWGTSAPLLVGAAVVAAVTVAALASSSVRHLPAWSGSPATGEGSRT